MVLGSGVYRIGSSVEFDWCSVSAIRTLRKLGKKAVMVNYNPETVSTDYDECDRLYFEEISLERVLDIYEQETCDLGDHRLRRRPDPEHARAVGDGPARSTSHPRPGTSPQMIDTAEDRNKFSALCDSRSGSTSPSGRCSPPRRTRSRSARSVGYPCLVRPSYVLSGAAMNVAYSSEELEGFLTRRAAR